MNTGNYLFITRHSNESGPCMSVVLKTFFILVCVGLNGLENVWMDFAANKFRCFGDFAINPIGKVEVTMPIFGNVTIINGRTFCGIIAHTWALNQVHWRQYKNCGGEFQIVGEYWDLMISCEVYAMNIIFINSIKPKLWALKLGWVLFRVDINQTRKSCSLIYSW